jgi:hypothetical protein
MRRLSFVVLGMLFAASTTLATTYVRVEKDGTKTYSDRPLPGGQPIDVQPAQTYSAPPVNTAPSSVPREQRLLSEVDDFRYANCSTRPGQDETFTNPEAVNLSVSLSPPLRPGDTIDLTVDGRSVGDGTGSYTLRAPIDRGTHTVAVNVKDRFGRSLCTASSQFHVFRPSVNMPGRGLPARPRN